MKIKQNISVFKVISKRLPSIAILLAGIIFTMAMPLFVAAAPGDLDPTFGGGKVLTPIRSGFDNGRAVAVQGDGKIVVAGYYYEGASEGENTAIVRYNTDGTIDTTFGNSGKLLHNHSSTIESWTAIAIQPDGKIVVVGYRYTGSNYDFIINRFTANGGDDASFNGGNAKTTDISLAGRNDQANAVALQSDGKIVVVGYSNSAATSNDFAFVRYNSDGSLDTSFSGDGIFTINYTLGNGNDSATAVAIQSDGKIVATGINVNSNLGFIRLNIDGTVDSSASVGGANEADGRAIAIQPDGKIVVGGYEYGSGFSNFALARYNPDGTGDLSFDSDARVTTSFNSGNSIVYGISIQPDGKIVAAGHALVGGDTNVALARYNANGSLDTGFDGDGKIISRISSFSNLAFGVALQSDGKIVAAGYGRNGATDDIAVARYNINGSLDSTFAPGGKIITTVNNYDDIGYAVAVQTDGKIVTAGYGGNGTNYDFALFRHNPDGTLDTTFGNNGKVTTAFIGNTSINDQDYGYALAIGSDGKIVVAGQVWNGNDFDFGVARYNSNGSLDMTFNSSGKKLFSFSPGSSDEAYAVALQSDGKTVIAGATGSGSARNSAVVRLDVSGGFDSSFNGSGLLVIPVSSSDSDYLDDITIQPDGKIVGVGHAYIGGAARFSLLRLTNSGALDSTFDGDGIVTTTAGSGNAELRAVALQSDGKIVVTGYSFNGLNNDFALARYNSNGSLDTSFDSDGIVSTAIGTSNEVSWSINVQSDGRLVVAGWSTIGSSNDFALARYNTNGSLDTSFDGDGKLTTAFGSGLDEAFSAAIQHDGKIVAAGVTNNGANNDFAIARYLPGADCTFSISPTSINVSALPPNGSITVTTNESYCTWNATGNDAWISLQNGGNRTGSGTVSYTIDANYNTASRTGTVSIAGQTFTINQAGAAINVSIPTGLTSLKNTTLTVPVNVGDTTGTGIISYDFRVTYDPALLTPLATPFDKTGTLSSGFEVNVNNSTPGTLIVSGFGSSSLSGMGALLNLKFNTVGDPPNCGALNFTSFQFNEGNPASTTTGGQACVIGGAISGRVTYATAPQQTFVPNVTLTAVGSVNRNAVTNVGGTYTLTGLSGGAYTVTPSKTGEVNGAVSALDASLVAQNVIGLATLNSNQEASADVSGNGTITSFDAGLIAQYVVGLPNPGNTGTWKFTPVSRNYPNTNADQINQDYSAILMGDVTGSWTVPLQVPFAGESFAAELDESNSIAVGFGKAKANRSGELIVPVLVSDLSSKGVYSFEFELEYDAEALNLEQTTDITRLLEISGSLSGNFSFAVNPLERGKVKISAYGISALEGEGVLLNLKFKAAAKKSRSSELKWQNFRFNEGEQKTRLKDGTVTFNGKSETRGKIPKTAPDETREN